MTKIDKITIETTYICKTNKNSSITIIFIFFYLLNYSFEEIKIKKGVIFRAE